MANLVTNGTFDTDIIGWVAHGSPSVLEWSAGRLHVVAEDGDEGAKQVVAGVAMGTWLYFHCDFECISGDLDVLVGGGPTYNQDVGGKSSIHAMFQQGTADLDVFFRRNTGAPAEFYIDNVWLEEFTPMALATSINVTIRDAKNRQSVVSTNVLAATTLDNAVEVAQQFATLLDAVTIGQIIGISLVVNAALPGGLDVYDAASDVEEGALFLLDCAGGVNSRMTVPTFDESMILTDSRIVDLTDVDVAALVTFLEDGFTTTEPLLVEPTEYREADVEAVAQAYEVFRKSQGKPT